MQQRRGPALKGPRALEHASIGWPKRLSLATAAAAALDHMSPAGRRNLAGSKIHCGPPSQSFQRQMAWSRWRTAVGREGRLHHCCFDLVQISFPAVFMQLINRNAAQKRNIETQGVWVFVVEDALIWHRARSAARLAESSMNGSLG